MKTKILITGVAGFIGSNLADRLLQEGKYEVHGLDNLAYGKIEQVPEGVIFHHKDIRDKSIHSIFEGMDYVFHFAAKNSISDCQKDPFDTVDINITGTVNVMDACIKANVKKIIYAESSALYEGSSVMPTPESEVHPESFYALSKYATMLLSEAYTKYFGLKYTALRYFCVYGPRQDYRRSIPPVFSAFIIKLLRGQEPLIYGNGEKRRDFIYVDDINDFHIQCLSDSRSDGKVFNLGSGQNYSINEIYHQISNLLNIDIPPKYLEDLPGEAFANLANIDEAKSLGWSPKTDLKLGLEKSIAYIKSELAQNNIA